MMNNAEKPQLNIPRVIRIPILSNYGGGMVSWGLETLNLITNDSKRDTLRN